jgi:hypothetical protein
LASSMPVFWLTILTISFIVSSNESCDSTRS